jgi:hypothetical protein
MVDCHREKHRGGLQIVTNTYSSMWGPPMVSEGTARAEGEESEPGLQIRLVKRLEFLVGEEEVGLELSAVQEDVRASEGLLCGSCDHGSWSGLLRPARNPWEAEASAWVLCVRGQRGSHT